MTIREYFQKYLESNGMFENEASEVMDAVIREDTTLRGRWDDQVEGYSQALIAIFRISVKHEALKWVDKSCPEAWYRPLFAKDK